MIFLLIILMDLVSAANAMQRVIDCYSGDDLPIIDTIMGSRRTNVGINQDLYPVLNFGSVVNCHPYNPTEVLDDLSPMYPSYPLIIQYSNQSALKDMLPDLVKPSLTSESKFYLNVQSNPWNGNQILLRPHGLFLMGENHQNVQSQVYRHDGKTMLNETSNVHLHDGVASPNNFPINGINHSINESFYSVVTYDYKTVLTQHILLTIPACELFQDLFCVPTVYNRSPSFFADMLGNNWTYFLKNHNVIA